MKRNNRPRIKPWGIPAVILAQEGTYPFNAILCFLLSKKSSKISTKLLDMPFCSKFYENVNFC